MCIYIMNLVKVSVIIPVRNEEKDIKNMIDSILLQDYPLNDIEYIFVDGSSTDNTKNIIDSYKDKIPNLLVLDNPNKTVPYSMNIGIRASRGKYIVRLDAHTEYANDYISKCIYYLDTTDAANVGGPMITKGNTKVQRVVAASYYSSFALGGGLFHKPDFEGYVDTVYLGAFKKETLLKVGLYDEKFTRNQDGELNIRILESGGKIFLTPNIRSLYYPRDSLKKLFSQYFQYGFWKVRVIRKHKKLSRLSHIIPLSFVLFLILGFGLSFVHPFFKNGYLAVISIYLLMNIVCSFKNKYLNSFSDKLLLVLVHFILHISYGLGFLTSIIKGDK